jgi:hypothetical protein
LKQQLVYIIVSSPQRKNTLREHFALSVALQGKTPPFLSLDMSYSSASRINFVSQQLI